MYKAIISDFDGTIVDHDLVLKQEVADKVIEFQQKGFIFTIASGRGYFGNLANAVSQMKISNPIIIRNGAEIIIPGINKVIFGKYLDTLITSEIIAYLIKENLEFYVEQGNYTFSVDAKPGKHAPNEQYLDVKSLEPVNIPKILIKVNTAVDAAKYSEYFHNEFSQQISIKMNPIKEGDYV
jgi:hydroxymethylpyrimidine pyrophosphatase-like HAD family hydrolase